MKKTILGAAYLGAALAMASAAQAEVLTAGGGEYCREYTQTVTIGGKTQKGYGTACLQPDGSWRMVTPAEAEDAAGVYDTAAPGDGISYIVEDQQVVMVPPEPFVYGDVWLGGSVHHFDRGFRPGPRRHGGWHGGHHH